MLRCEDIFFVSPHRRERGRSSTGESDSQSSWWPSRFLPKQTVKDRLRAQGQTVYSQYSHAVDVLGFCCCIESYGRSAGSKRSHKIKNGKDFTDTKRDDRVLWFMIRDLDGPARKIYVHVGGHSFSRKQMRDHWLIDWLIDWPIVT